MLELYQSEACPYSQTVRETMSNLGLSYIAHNPRFPEDEGGEVTNDTTHQELQQGGNDQIPYLVDSRFERTLFGSDDIVDYLHDTYENG